MFHLQVVWSKSGQVICMPKEHLDVGLAQSEGNAGASSSDSSSSSSSSSSRPEGAAAPAPARPRRASDQQAARIALKPFTVHGLFRITPKPPGLGGPHGGYQGLCPYHKKNEQTRCKKWSPLLGESEAHRKDAIRRLLEWLIAGGDYTRQRHHMARPLTEDVASLPQPAALRAQCLAMQLPQEVVGCPKGPVFHETRFWRLLDAKPPKLTENEPTSANLV